jgi:glycosidase
MCWNKEENFGFSTSNPWIPISKDGSTTNVEEESKNSKSLLNLYKKLITIRKKEGALQRGSQKLLFINNDKILAYIRIYNDQKIIVLLNFTSEETRFFSGDEISGYDRGKVLFSTNRKEESYFDLNIIALLPYEGIIIKLEA